MFSFNIIFSVVYLVSVSCSVFLSKTPLELLVAYILVSIFTFAVYAKDKRAAVNGKWRTKESTLHLLSLIGGWPGALVAQNKLRHKSKKQPFKLILWITIICNCAAFIWTLTPEGSSFSKAILAEVTQLI